MPDVQVASGFFTCPLYDDYTEAMEEAERYLAVGFGIKVYWMFRCGSWRALGARERSLWPRSR